MAPAAHARLSPSASVRFLNCPASLLLEEQFPNKSTPDSAKGTLAHAIGELKLRFYFGTPVMMPKKEYTAELKRLKQDELYEPKMNGDTDMYLDAVKELALSFPAQPTVIALEQRVDASQWAPGCWGTADCVLAGGGRLCVVDYKNGVTPVAVEHNPQLMIYALGALATFQIILGDSIKQVSLTIVQPNNGGVKTWELTTGELLKWGEEVLRPGAELAMSGKGPAHADPNGWCKFCRAQHVCRALTRMRLSLESAAHTEPKLLSDDELGDVLRRGAGLISWYERLKEYALSAALSGRKITGFKAVEGRCSYEWKDQDATVAALRERGVDDAMLWERKFISVNGLKKMLGKKEFDSTAKGLWQRTPGKPALVEEGDPRDPYNAARVVFTEVK